MPLPLPLPLHRGNLGVIAAYAIELVCCACAHTIIASSAHNDRQCGKGGICFGFFVEDDDDDGEPILIQFIKRRRESAAAACPVELRLNRSWLGRPRTNERRRSRPCLTDCHEGALSLSLSLSHNSASCRLCLRPRAHPKGGNAPTTTEPRGRAPLCPRANRRRRRWEIIIMTMLGREN